MKEIQTLEGSILNIRNTPRGLLLGTSHGLYLLPDLASSPIPLIEDVIVNAVVNDDYGNLYVGTRKNGLMVASFDNPDDWQQISGKVGNHILDLEIRGEDLWVADYQNGFSQIPLQFLW